MSEKSKLQKPVIDYLQKNGMDFIHLPNNAFGGKSAAYATTAFKEHDIHETFSCTKYFPDLVFPWHGKVYMVEFGLPGSNMNRKEKQMARMNYWERLGGCIPFMITEEAQVQRLLTSLENEKPHYLMDETEKTTK